MQRLDNDLYGKNIFFYGFLLKNGFGHYIAEHLLNHGANVYCLVNQAQKDMHGTLDLPVLPVPIECDLWYGLPVQLFPGELKKSMKVRDMLRLGIEANEYQEAFRQSEALSLQKAALAFRKLERVTGGKLDVVIHLMAGGIPRLRSLMRLMNVLFRTDNMDRFIESEKFYQSDLFKHLLKPNIDLVSAISYDHIFVAGEPLLRQNPQCEVLALGYIGEHILCNQGHIFSSYPGYFLGHAKQHLQAISDCRRSEGFRSTVVNLMGAISESTKAFYGLDCYILNSYKQIREAGILDLSGFEARCGTNLRPEFDMNDLITKGDEYLFSSQMIKAQNGSFPVQQTREIAEISINTQKVLTSMHLPHKESIAFIISRLVKQMMAVVLLNIVGKERCSRILLDVRRIIEEAQDCRLSWGQHLFQAAGEDFSHSDIRSLR